MDSLAEVLTRLERIETLLAEMRESQAVKEWYTPEEFATALGRAEFTVQNWCRQGRIRAEKRRSDHGPFAGWAIPHEELVRYRREGLLAPNRG